MTQPPPPEQPPYGQAPSGQPPYGQPTYGQPTYGQPPYGAPLPPTHAYPQPPKKPRPSAWWFLLPTLLVVAAVVSVAVFGLLAFKAFRFDGPVPVDGRAHTVTLDNTEPHVLWAGDPQPSCTVTDTGTGEELPLTSTTGTFTRSTNDRPDDVAWLQFTPRSDSVDVTCTGVTGSDVMVGTRPDVGRLVGGILGAILLPLGLGTLALISLIVLVILFAVRGRRPKRA